ncbi:TorD/DmsD family molecular chaperone [Halodesulfurarchaeum sp.]|uniref:TorD/DmsD family molecular chaperone n=1 Tax=Halodesulfurarchaeum sp. TaxID=1980530 RepID=UPI001BC1C77B|nr:molecular chaperone TorD family protein [Halodesulfurarchaeum sp.]
MHSEDTSPEDATLAQLYDLLSGVLSDPPDAATVEALSTGPLPEPDIAPNDQLRAGLEALAEWGETVTDPEAEADRLAAEFTRLFVGPRPKLQIHESYYEDDFLGEPLAAVTQTFKQLGIAPAPDLKEEADHAAVELAALRELTLENADRKRVFLSEHGEWFVELAADIKETTDEPFYEAVADIVAGLIVFDAQREGVRQ